MFYLKKINKGDLLSLEEEKAKRQIAYWNRLEKEIDIFGDTILFTEKIKEVYLESSIELYEKYYNQNINLKEQNNVLEKVYKSALENEKFLSQLVVSLRDDIKRLSKENERLKKRTHD